MKSFVLLSLVATLLLGGCASFSRRNEVEVQVPPRDSVVRDQVPAEGSRKIPVIQQY